MVICNRVIYRICKDQINTIVNNHVVNPFISQEAFDRNIKYCSAYEMDFTGANVQENNIQIKTDAHIHPFLYNFFLAKIYKLIANGYISSLPTPIS